MDRIDPGNSASFGRGVTRIYGVRWGTRTWRTGYGGPVVTEAVQARRFPRRREASLAWTDVPFTCSHLATERRLEPRRWIAGGAPSPPSVALPIPIFDRRATVQHMAIPFQSMATHPSEMVSPSTCTAEPPCPKPSWLHLLRLPRCHSAVRDPCKPPFPLRHPPEAPSSEPTKFPGRVGVQACAQRKGRGGPTSRPSASTSSTSRCVETHVEARRKRQKKVL